jgi:phosphoglycolate phosphatase-like HAD superfamily hydrolase
VKVEAVIFDFDGTLINLDERELYAINKALASVGKPILSMHDFIEGYYLHPYTEVGSSSIIRRVLGGWDTSGKAVETYSNEFWNNPYLVKLQDETVNVLKALRDKRISLAIATFRKRRTIIEKEIHYLKIDGFVDALVTRQDIEWSPQERPTLGNM